MSAASLLCSSSQASHSSGGLWPSPTHSLRDIRDQGAKRVYPTATLTNPDILGTLSALALPHIPPAGLKGSGAQNVTGLLQSSGPCCSQCLLIGCLALQSGVDLKALLRDSACWDLVISHQISGRSLFSAISRHALCQQVRWAACMRSPGSREQDFILGQGMELAHGSQESVALCQGCQLGSIQICASLLQGPGIC